MKTIEPYIANQIVEFSRVYLLRPRVYRIRATVAAAAGSGAPDVPLNLPTSNPFLFCALGWCSSRPNEGRYTSFKLETEQVSFMGDLVKLGEFGGPNGEWSPTPWGPSIISKTDRFKVSFVREQVVDPAETYPGAALPSLIEVGFIGFDCLPRSAAEQKEQAQA